ncbi:MAG: hypothetical protein JXQ91_16145 [Vannielia sp.]|uniref:hypothetical protein n=1 Tax=Vannielia sp. TaxID=2813045 RepID=UPI003B8E0B22
MKFWIKALAAAIIAAPALAENGATLREATEGLAGFTVIRPAELSGYEANSLPVMIWANGGCRSSHFSRIAYLTGVAQAGYVVVAVGAPDDTSDEGGPEQPARIIAALDWLNSTEAATQLDGKLDTEAVTASGTSCGGLEALLAAKDDRVTSVLALNSGFFPEGVPGREGRVDIRELAAVHVPTLIFNGGPEDIAHDNSILNFEQIDAPALLVSLEGVGHSGLTLGLENNSPSATALFKGIRLTTDWLDFTLKGDEAAGARFLAESCAYCGTDGWSIRAKGF